MSSSNRMLTFQLVALVWSYLVSSLALAYTTSGSTGQTSNNRPFVHHPIDWQEILITRTTPTTQHFPNQEEATYTASGRYNLGIGKNRPLIKKEQQAGDDSTPPFLLPTSFQDDHIISDQHHQADHASTTQFLVEHAAAREYPSPLQSAREELVQPSSKTQPPPQQTRKMPQVQHERRVKDVLHIDHPSEDVGNFTPTTEGGDKNVMKPSSSSSPLLPFIRASSKVQLDVNTVWVEMMLHSEHMKSVSTVSSAV